MSASTNTSKSAHITPELLDAMTEHELPPAVLSRLIWDHLRSVCPTCRQNLDHWLDRNRQTPTAAGFPVPHQARPGEPRPEEEAVVRRELEELLETPVPERLEKVAQGGKRFHSGLLVDRLLQRTEDWLHEDPRKAIQLAGLASAVAERGTGSKSLDRRVRAGAHLANALRASGDLRAAEAKLHEVRGLAGSAAELDVRIFGEVDWIEGDLRLDQKRFAEAERMLSRALLVFRTFGWSVMVAKALLDLAFLHHQTGLHDESLACIREAVDLLDPEENLDLVCFARQNLASLLCDTGDPEGAQRVLQESEELFARYLASRPAREPRLKLRWLEGRIARGLDDHDTAERALREAAEGFVHLQIGYDAALAYLDLAGLYLARGQVDEVARLAAAVEPVLKANDLAEEAVAALAMFRSAATRQHLTASILDQVRGRLLQTRRPGNGGG